MVRHGWIPISLLFLPFTTGWNLAYSDDVDTTSLILDNSTASLNGTISTLIPPTDVADDGPVTNAMLVGGAAIGFAANIGIDAILTSVCPHGPDSGAPDFKDF